MIKVKDGYAKLIGTTYAGSAERVLLSNGGDFGIHTGTNNQANKIVRTDANGYIYAGWINTTSGNFTGTPTKIYASNDAFIRYMTPANFFPTLANDNNQLSITVGGQNRKLTVAYATAAGSATNIYVNQHTTNDIEYPLVWSNACSTSSSLSNQLYKSYNNLMYNPKNNRITASTFKGNLEGKINPFKSISYTSGTSTVKDVKDELVTAFSNITTGIGANVIVPAYAINYWDTESTIVKDSNVYSMIKIGGGYSGTTYGQWLLSTYSSNRIGYVGRNNNSWTSISWIATTADINSLKNYYWANVKISSSSNSETTPTFKTATATTSVTTPLVNSTGRLTLNATNTGLDLKFGNDNTKSVILNSTAFKPFDSANNKLTLGSDSARWSNVYSYLGNFKDTVHIYADSSGNYTEGIRLYGTAKDSTWSNIQFGCDPAATSGTHANQWLIGRDNNNRFVFRNNTTDRLYVLSDGKVGINVVPTQMLHVNGNAMATNLGVNAQGGGNGISLYNGVGSVGTYGIAFNQTSNWETHGYVTGDWATYFTMNNQGDRGWIFRAGSNRFSIDGDGHAYANGLVNANYFVSRVATGTQPYQCTSTTLNTNLNADLLDGQHGSRYLKALGGSNYVTITVNGDAATYYPVVISSVSDKYPMQFVNISRGYSETAPSSWHSSTHKGGLTLTLLWNGSQYWDGNSSGGACYCVFVNETYCTMVGGLDNSTSGKVVWLRGGGAVYHIHAMQGTSVTATVYTSTFTDSASRSFAPTTSVKGYTVRWPGDITGSSASVRDAGNSTAITLKYSSGGFSSNPSYLAAWNGYQITYVAPSYVTVGSASKLGSSTLGGTYQPIYLSSGTATAGTSYAKAIKSITRSGTTFTYTCIDGTTGTFTQQDNNSTYSVYGKTINASYKTAYRTQTKGNTTNGYYISAIRCDTASVSEAPQYGSGIAFGNEDTHGYLYMNYSTANAYIGGGDADKLNWTATLLHSGNSSVSKSGQTLTVKINGVEQSLTNTTYSSLKNPNAIKFKNTSGTTITYDGSSAADLTAGVNYATSAGTATTISGFTKRATANCTWGTLTSSNGYTPVYWGDTASSGGIGFSDKGGKTYMQIDGDYYAQEGTKLVLHTGNSSVSGGGSSGGSSITVNIGGTSKTLTIPTSLPANGGNADTVDNLHATSFAIWRGDASTDSTATDTSSTSTADFFAKINATSGLFNSRFGAMRGSWQYVGNTQLNTGVGTLEMVGTAVLNLGSNTDTNDTYKSLLFLDQGGRLWSYTANETSVKQWSRYVKTTDKIANASWADGASTVTVNDSNANSTYRMVWHSGNTLYSTGGIYCNPYTDYLYAASVQTSDWFRSSGNTGWYSQTHGGGWYMTDSTWVRNYNSKQLYLSVATYPSLVCNAQDGSESNIRFEIAGANKGYVGYHNSYGTFLFNSTASKYVYVNNNGYFYTQSYINVGAGNEKNASNPPYVWGVNGSDNFMRTYATSSLSAGYLKIHDIRNNNYAPNSTSWPQNNIRAWFNNTGTPDGTWWSGITTKGQDNTYNVWQLAGTSHNSDYNIKGLFFRTGNGSTWDDWQSVSTARIFTVANNTAVADFVKSYKQLYAGQWFSRRDYAWASSATINVGSYGLDRMRYSAVCVRTGNLNEIYQQSAMLFVPTFSDRKFLYLAQMYTSDTAGSVTTSVKRYADYDTIIQGSSEHVTLIWMGYIYRESTAVTTWTATKLGGPATFNLTISNSARSGTNSRGGAKLGGNCSGYTILGGICNTRYFGQDNLSAGSTNWAVCRDSGMGDYMVYADGANIYIRKWRQVDNNNGSARNDAFGATAINNQSNNDYGYALTRSFTLYIFGYKNNNL